MTESEKQNGKEAAEIIRSLGDGNAKTKGNYVITINVFNESRIGLKQVDVSVKDNETGDVQSTTFGHINAGRSDTRTVLLSGGVDMVADKVYPEVGEPVTGVGFAANVSEVNIHITN